MNSFILKDPSTGQSKFYRCLGGCNFVNCTLDTIPKDKTFPIFYSLMEAKKAGWVFTDDRSFCPPDVKSTWVCPDCWKSYTKEVER